MNAAEKFALERDDFEREMLGLPRRVFANEKERQAFARDLLAKESQRNTARPTTRSDGPK
jgi:hypothetical protein